MRLILFLMVLAVIVLFLIALFLPRNNGVAEAAKVAREQSRRFPWVVLLITLGLIALVIIPNLFVDEGAQGVVLILSGLYLYLVVRLVIIALTVYLIWRIFLFLVPMAQSIGTDRNRCSDTK